MFTPDEIAEHMAQIERERSEKDLEVSEEGDPLGDRHPVDREVAVPVAGRPAVGPHLERRHRVLEDVVQAPVLELGGAQVADQLPHLVERTPDGLVDPGQCGAQRIGRRQRALVGVGEVGLEELHLQQGDRELLGGAVVDVEPHPPEHPLVGGEDLGHGTFEVVAHADRVEDQADPQGAGADGMAAQIVREPSSPATKSSDFPYFTATKLLEVSFIALVTRFSAQSPCSLLVMKFEDACVGVLAGSLGCSKATNSVGTLFVNSLIRS